MLAESGRDCELAQNVAKEFRGPMGLVGELKRRARHVVGPLLGIVAVAYFAYHTVHGDRGVLAYLQMRERVDEAERRYQVAENERQYWERRVKLLYPASIDPDMLDERVRAMLGYARADDLIVLTKPTEMEKEKPHGISR